MRGCSLRFSLILLLQHFLASGCWAAPQYFSYLWQTEDGLPQNAVTAILQTHDGYLWLGTYGGLVRFDGVRFVIFDTTTAPELKSSRVTSLFEDASGTLWIGHENGEVTQYRDGHFKTTPALRSGKARKVFALAADESGEIWQLDDDGLMTRFQDGLLLVPPAGTAAGQLSFAVDGSHHIWLARQGRLSRLEHDRMSAVQFPGETEAVYVQGVCASRDGGVWVGVDGKVRKFKDGVLADDLGPAPWGLAGLNQMLETQDGDIVGGTVDSGLHLLTPEKTVLSFTRTNGLMPENWVRSLFEDRERNMWVGSGSGGLVALRRAKVSVLTPPDHWQGRAVLSVTARNTNDIWVGTEGAGVYRSHMGVWSQLGAETGLSHLFAWTVSQDAEGRIWVGTWGGGIFLEENGKFNRVPKLEDLRTPTQAIYHGKGGVTWIGTDDGLLRYEGGKVVQYGEAEGLQVPHVRTMLESPDGTLWFGMFGGGLGSLSGGALKQYGIRDGLTSEFVQCLKLDSDGALWIGTSGGGLFRFKNGRFAAITKAQGLPDNVICDIEADGRGYFWMSSHAGIIRASKAELNACADGVTNQIDCLTYARGEGMPTLECSGGLQPAGCRTADGKLWFATSKGLVRLDPEEVKRNSLPPPVLIEELKVDDKTQSPQPLTVKPKTSSPRTQTAITDNVNTHDFRIAPGAHRYEFTFTALSFTVPEKVRFRYRLEGLDPHWTDAGTKRSVNYSYIPPGSYTFRVTACNNDGVWNEIGAAVTLTVLPQFWQTWWFRLLAVIFSAALVTAVVVLVTRRRMREKMDRLERQRAVERERTRIARDIHDDLGASLTRITMLSQSARAELENSTAAADVDRIYDTARELTRAMDEIVWAVNPKHDTLDSLATYLGRFAQGFLAASHVSCRLDLPMQLPSWPVTAETRHNLFLAFKESLNNAIKHSGTKEVHVSMDMADAGFSLVVEDTGCGFEANGAARPRAEFPRTATGNGFLHMRQRLDEIGGQCEITSSPGKGTKVVFVVPVKLAKA